MRNDKEISSFVKNAEEFVEDPSNGLAELPLDIRGTEFQKRVWKSLLDILPARQAPTRKSQKKIGSPNAIRAVVNACLIWSGRHDLNPRLPSPELCATGF